MAQSIKLKMFNILLKLKIIQALELLSKSPDLNPVDLVLYVFTGGFIETTRNTKIKIVYGKFQLLS